MGGGAIYRGEIQKGLHSLVPQLSSRTPGAQAPGNLPALLALGRTKEADSLIRCRLKDLGSSCAQRTLPHVRQGLRKVWGAQPGAMAAEVLVGVSAMAWGLLMVYLHR